MPNKLYKISDYIFPRSKLNMDSDINEIILTHIISRKKFQINPGLFKILLLFKLGMTIEHCMAINDEKEYVNTKYFMNNINYLINNFIIVDCDVTENNVQHSEYPNLLNVKNFNENRFGKEIIFLGIPFGFGNKENSKCDKFPDYIRKYCHLRCIDITKIKNVESLGFINYDTLIQNIKQNNISDWGNLYVNVNENPSSVYGMISDSIFYLLKKGKIPFVIGGDHSITYTIIKSISSYYSKCVIFHFDAHLDTYRKLDDNLTISPKNCNHANFMSKCLDLESVKHVFHFGIRGINNLNVSINKQKQTVVWSHQLKNINFDGIIDACKDTPVYISFDIDFFDDSIAPGTVTPVANGSNYDELLSILASIKEKLNIIGFDLVEVNPDFDIKDKTAEISTLVLMNFINLINI